MLSGVGPAGQLRDHGIAVVLDRAGVGENLQDHLQLRVIYKVTGARTLNEASHSAAGRIGMALQYALLRRGPLTMAPSQLGLFTRSDPGRDRANIQFHVQPLSLDRFGEPLHRFPAFTASVTNVQPTSRGQLWAAASYAKTRCDDSRGWHAFPIRNRAAVARKGLAA
jgi:choline dehydrogenase